MAVSEDAVGNVNVIVIGILVSDTTDRLLIEEGMADVVSLVVADDAGVIDALPAKLSNNPSGNEAASAARLWLAAICEVSAVTGVAIPSVPQVVPKIALVSELTIDACSSHDDSLGCRLK
jgi:ApbE superfamily uncharacterized protein (UPF0280 family)